MFTFNNNDERNIEDVDVDKVFTSYFEVDDGMSASGAQLVADGDWIIFVGYPTVRCFKYDTTYRTYIEDYSFTLSGSGIYDYGFYDTGSPQDTHQMHNWKAALDGDTLAIGCEFNHYDASYANYVENAGAVYVYKYNSGSGFWELEQKIVSSSRNTDDFFGYALALSGDTLLIRKNDDVEVWDRSGTTWSYTSSISNSIVGGFGTYYHGGKTGHHSTPVHAIAIKDDLAVIEMWYDRTTGEDWYTGMAFERSGTWSVATGDPVYGNVSGSTYNQTTLQLCKESGSPDEYSVLYGEYKSGTGYPVGIVNELLMKKWSGTQWLNTKYVWNRETSPSITRYLSRGRSVGYCMGYTKWAMLQYDPQESNNYYVVLGDEDTEEIVFNDDYENFAAGQLVMAYPSIYPTFDLSKCVIAFLENEDSTTNVRLVIKSVPWEY